MKILTLIIALLIPSYSYAVEFTLNGNVTSTSVHPIYGGSEYTSLFSIGDAWRVNLTLDTNTINSCSYSGQEGGVYSFANLGTASIGSKNFVLRSGALEMNTQDGNCGSGLTGVGAIFRFFNVDSNDFGFPQPLIEGAAWFTYPGYNIPETLPSNGYLTMRIGAANINGTFATPELRTIPEPSSLILLTLGILYGRRRS